MYSPWVPMELCGLGALGQAVPWESDPFLEVRLLHK
jgi:hypothetical protein